MMTWRNVMVGDVYLWFGRMAQVLEKSVRLGLIQVETENGEVKWVDSANLKVI